MLDNAVIMENNGKMFGKSWQIFVKYWENSKYDGKSWKIWENFRKTWRKTPLKEKKLLLTQILISMLNFSLYVDEISSCPSIHLITRFKFSVHGKLGNNEDTSKDYITSSSSIITPLSFGTNSKLFLTQHVKGGFKHFNLVTRNLKFSLLGNTRNNRSHLIPGFMNFW